MIKQLLFCMSLLLVTVSSIAQDSFTCRAQRYIAQYASYAIAEQQRCGVPASITLAQGVLETEAGRSELVAKGNNHFGIKCKNGYCGPKMFHDDDRPGEAFIVYSCAEASYKDHSDYLKRNKRYEPLFTYPTTDYKSWARGLKRCGYATNPIYAERLIKLIEDFGLQEYTLKALENTATAAPSVAAIAAPANGGTTPAPAPLPKPASNRVVVASPSVALAGALANDTVKKTQSVGEAAKQAPIASAVSNGTDATITSDSDTQKTTPPQTTTVQNVTSDLSFDSGKVIVVNGLRAFYANKGEMLLQYAVKYKLRYPKLLEINDLPDAPLAENTLVYLEKKHNEGTHAKHTVRDGETLFKIAQQEGIVLKRLMMLNMLDAGDEPAIGTILELQNGANRKPTLRALPPVDLKTSHNLSFVAPTPPDAYVAVTHPAPADTNKVQPIRKEISRDTYVTTVHTAIDSAARVETVPAKPEIPAPIKPIVADTPKTADAATPAPAADTAKDELATLKAKLDKVVYPTDTKQAKNDKPVKSEPIILSPLGDEPTPRVKKGTKPVAAKAEKSGGSYTVKKGDNLSKIAQSHHTTIDAIVALNKIEPDELHLGQKLRIPGSNETAQEPDDEPEHKSASHKTAAPSAKYYTVKKGDNLSNIAKSQHITVKEILRLNDIDADDLHLGQKLKLK